MPVENTTIFLNRGTRNTFKSMACLLVAVITGVILVIMFNNKHIPFARSLNKQPLQMIGLFFAVAATFALLVLFVRCLVMSSDTTQLTSPTTYAFTIPSQPPDSYYRNQQGATIISGVMTQPSLMNAVRSTSAPPSEQINTHQMSVPQTPPPEFEFPPSYAEATKGLPVIKY